MGCYSSGCGNSSPLISNNTCLVNLAGKCVYYSGNTIPTPRINPGDNLDTIINKLITYINGLPGTIYTANDGLTLSSDVFKLGQTVAQVGNPAALLENREIPLGGFNLQLGTDSTGRLILKPLASSYRDILNSNVVTIQPTRNVTQTGNSGQNYTNIAVVNTVAYSNPSGSGIVADFGVGTAIANTSSSINAVAFHNRSSITSTGGSGDYISFFSNGSFSTGAGATGNIRGFYHSPNIISNPGGLNIAIENVTGYCLFNSTGIGSGGCGFTGFDASNLPTALIHIGSSDGSAGSAPLKLSPGTLLSTAENGAIEFNGTHYYGTVGGVRFQLDNEESSVPGGSDGQVQFNSSGTFAGSAYCTWSTANNRLKVGNGANAASTIIDVVVDNLGDGTANNGISLTNSTAGTAISTQQSPSIRFRGNGWNTTDGVSTICEWRTRLIAQDSSITAAANADLVFEYGSNGSSFVNAMIVRGTGTTVPTILMGNLSADNIVTQNITFPSSNSVLKTTGTSIQLTRGTNPSGFLITNTDNGVITETASIGFNVATNIFFIGTSATAGGTVRPIVIGGPTSIGDANPAVATTLRLSGTAGSSHLNLQALGIDPTSPSVGDIWLNANQLWLETGFGQKRLNNQSQSSRWTAPQTGGVTVFTAIHNAGTLNYSISILALDANSVGPYYINNITENTFDLVYLTPPTDGINVTYTIFFE